MAYYRTRKELFLKAHPMCDWKEEKRATEIHHVRGRAGTLLLDERFWKALCSTAHDFVHENMAMAREVGLLCQVGEWNTAPDDDATRRLKCLIEDLTR